MNKLHLFLVTSLVLLVSLLAVAAQEDTVQLYLTPWIDDNNNGKKDDDDMVRRKFDVTLFDDAGEEIEAFSVTSNSPQRARKLTRGKKYCVFIADAAGELLPIPKSEDSEIDQNSFEYCFTVSSDAAVKQMSVKAGFHKTYSISGITQLKDSSGEKPLANVHIELTKNDKPVQSFDSGENGEFLAGTLAAGDYCVTMKSKGNKPVDTIDEKNFLDKKGKHCFKLPTDKGDYKIMALFEKGGGLTISGNTWKDLNNNGVMDDGEEYFGPIKAILYKNDVEVNQWTIQGDEEGYSYTIEEDGDYTLEMTDETGDTQPTVLGKDNQIDPSSFNHAFKVPLESKEDRLTISGGFHTLYEFSGSAMLEEDGKDKKPLQGAKGRVLNDKGVEVQNFETDEDGLFFIGNLPSGTYTIELKHDKYSNIEGSDFDPKTNSVKFTMPPAEGGNSHELHALFGKSGFPVHGKTFKDINGNGLKDGDDKFIAGIKVTLYEKDKIKIVDTATTKEDGSYKFESVPEGSYCIRMMDPTGKTDPTTGKKGADGVVYSIIDSKGFHCFDHKEPEYEANGGFTQTFSISGINFIDANKNGINDKEKYYGPIRVTITSDDGTFTKTMTAPASRSGFKINDLKPGKYTVKYLDPKNKYKPTILGKDNKISPANNTFKFELDEKTVDKFGNYKIDEKGNFVTINPVFIKSGVVVKGVTFADTYGDGMINVGEKPIDNVKVTLYKNTEVQETTTNHDGLYRLKGIKSGSYCIKMADSTGTLVPTKKSEGIGAEYNKIDDQGFDRIQDQLRGGNYTVKFLDPRNKYKPTILGKDNKMDPANNTHKFELNTDTVNKIKMNKILLFLALSLVLIVSLKSVDAQPAAKTLKLFITPWIDDNNNGIRDSDEKTVRKTFDVTLFTESGVEIEAWEMDSNSPQISRALEAGKGYCVTVTSQDGELVAIPKSKDSVIDPSSFEYCFKIPADTTDKEFDVMAGFHKVYSVVGHTYLAEGDKPLPDVHVVIKDKDDIEVQSFDTGSEGEFLAGYLSAGDYCLTMKSKGNKPVDKVDEKNVLNSKGEHCFKLPPAEGVEYKIEARFEKGGSGSVIKGITWKDLNSNGVKDSNEEFYGPINAILYKGDDQVDSWTIQADAEGYTREIEEEGDYTLTMMDMSNGYEPTVLGKDNQIKKDSYLHAFKVPFADGATELTISGGFVQTYDLNGIAYLSDGPTQSPLPGAKGRVLNSKGEEVQKFETDPDGKYLVGSLEAGEYTLEFNHDEYILGYGFDPKTQSKKFTLPNPDGKDKPLTINAYFKKSGVVVSGLTFKDTNGDGIMKEGENPIGKIKVTLYRGNPSPGHEEILQETTTKDDGKYRFKGIEEGSYCIKMVDTTGKLVPSKLDGGLGAGYNKLDDKGLACIYVMNRALEIYGGFASTYSISGINFIDANKNGQNDKEKYYGPMRVTITKDDGTFTKTVTAPASRSGYKIRDLPAGKYTIKIVDPKNKYKPTILGKDNKISPANNTHKFELNADAVDKFGDYKIDGGWIPR
eukprot:gene6617-7690_t